MEGVCTLSVCPQFSKQHFQIFCDGDTDNSNILGLGGHDYICWLNMSLTAVPMMSPWWHNGLTSSCCNKTSVLINLPFDSCALWVVLFYVLFHALVLMDLVKNISSRNLSQHYFNTRSLLTLLFKQLNQPISRASFGQNTNHGSHAVLTFS